jgi:polyphosphate kinase
MFPVLQNDMREQVRDILDACFRDNRQSWALNAGGAWTRSDTAPGEEAFRAQEYFLAKAEEASQNTWSSKQEFVVRRRPPAENPE